MSWSRDGERYQRWGGSQPPRDDERWEEGEARPRPRSPVWELRPGSPERHARDARHRDRERDRDRERYDRKDRYERDSERYNRDRDRHGRERDRRRSPPRRYDDVPNPPSPPKISSDSERKTDSRRSSRSASREPQDLSDMYETGKPLEQMHHLQDDSQVTMTASPGDWYCRCGSYNFKRRQVCYRRNCSGKRSEGVVYGGGERTESTDNLAGITKRLLFRRLDALTTEEKILDTLKERCSKKVLDTIAGITIGREPLTGASKCLAYINFNSIADSTAAHMELYGLSPSLNIDGRDVLISYYNEPTKHQKPMGGNSAVDYANYYAQSYSNSSQSLSEADRVNAAAAVAQSAISAAQARQMSWTPVSVPLFVASSSQVSSNAKIPSGDGKAVYSAPDVRTFMYDETSGYYYDPATGLYYDGNTQYFYNNQINQYMYWDSASSTYIKATQSHQNNDQPKLPNPPEATVQNTIIKGPEEKNKKKDKEDKVKVAKKIAKDMERWARTLNQKKENARSNYVMEQPLDTGASKGSADIGFSVLGAGPSLATHVRELSPPPGDDFLVKKDGEPVYDNDEGIIDWSKLTCLLCKRKFPSAEILTKHKTMSDLHKQNLAEYRKKNELLPQTNGYRDRAAERRLKFGEDEPPPIRKRYEPPEAAPPPVSHPAPSVVDTIGGKMLQKMGWQEGRGLGKEEQGRTAPIEAEQRPNLAGLGQKRGIYTPTPGETYRDTVKKLMIARYKEVVGQEEANK